MQFQDVNIQNLISQFKAFSIEGFNIFGTGEDNLPHLVCVCPNRSFARAIQSLLIIAKRAEQLQEVNASVSGNCRPSVREEATELSESLTLLHVCQLTPHLKAGACRSNLR
jgi:hypothetical protein